MVGTAKKKENSAATFLVNFCCIPPMIVAALRLMPGISARHCQKPMVNPFLKVIFSSVSIVGALKSLSINNSTTPPNNKVTATVVGLSSKASMASDNTNPIASAGVTATNSLI